MLPKNVNNFHESLIEPRLTTLQFAFYFMHLERRRDFKEDYARREKARQGLDGRVVTQMMCSREGGYTSKGLERRILLACQSCANLDGPEQRTGLA